MANSHDKVKGPTREGDYLVLDEVTGLQIYASDAITDYWGRVTCAEWEAKPSPMEYMDTAFPVMQPMFGRPTPDPVAQTGTWFVSLNSNGDVTAIWYSDNYSPGQYTEATATQISNYVPVVNDQTFSYGYDGSDAMHTVGTISATDVTGYGLTWSITDDDTGAFSIDAATGVLYVAFLDLVAENTNYEITVQATSYFPGSPYDTATITIEVDGINAAPNFISVSSFTVDENTTAVGSVVAIDPEYTTVSYSITGGADQACFTIGTTSGALAFSSAPDYETPGDAGANNVYNVTVKATDTGGANNSQSIAVTVANVYEVPVITSNSTASVAENTTFVMTCAGYVDTGYSETWSVTGGADSSCFSINSSSGNLTFSTAPDYEIPGDTGANNVYNVTVGLSDGVSTTTQNIAVTVTNVEEGPSQYGSLYCWLDFSDDSNLTSNTGQLVSINNKASGHTDNFTAGSASLRPDLVTTKFGGKQAAYFNTQDRLNSSLAAASWNFLANGAGATVIAAVHMRSSTTASSFALMGNSGGSEADYIFNHGPTSGGTPYRFTPVVAGNTTNSSNNAWVLDTGYTVATVTKTAATQVEVYVNGISVGTGTLGGDTGTDPSTTLALGQSSASGTASSVWYLAELWIFNEVLTGSDLTDAIADMADRNNL